MDERESEEAAGAEASGEEVEVATVAATSATATATATQSSEVSSTPPGVSHGGKRGAAAPLAVNSSDEDEAGDDLPPCSSPAGVSPSPQLGSPPHSAGESQNEHDYAASPTASSPSPLDTDYENVSSPGSSSTASGPTYVRQPGFTQHAHEVISKPKIKKKKTLYIVNKDGILKRREPTPPKQKPKRDPLPMRLRALPQSFWQQPNVPQHVSPVAYPILPPVYTKDTEEDVSAVRPITPPSSMHSDERGDVQDVEAAKHSYRVGERKLTIANTDLLFKLFESVEKEKAKREPGTTSHPFKHRRGRKMVPSSNKSFINGQDPYIVDCVSEKLFPQLSLEQSKAHAAIGGNSTLQLVTLREGDKSVTLPALSIEQNYSQMLSELVMHI